MELEREIVIARRDFDFATSATELKPTEWTDEKHSLYLKSMEATFVNQLNKSLNLFGRHVQKNCQSESKSSKHKQNNICAPSSQVLRDGCWSKTDFRRDEAEVSQEESGPLSENPWIQHYKCSSERQTIRKVISSRAKDPLANTANQYSAYNFRLWRQDSVASNAEVTDQNFNEEDVEGEKSSRIHEMKRTRTSTDKALNNDQVVPFENIVQADDVAEDHED
ncbi:hypothetical protein DH2020_035360 [Rehmannia glutinosa]|uniref:Uncharacterized protein n=1 Tax=Rehmannia glutinosa TaxID=99300 RepID=A0ABR0VA99_REHGL